MGQAALKMKPKEAEYELLSIQKIAFRVNLNRATCKKRLDEFGYEAETDTAKLKLYRFDAKMEADLTETNDAMRDVKIRQFTADARLREIKVEREMGNLVPMVEVVDTIQRLFSSMHKEIGVRMPKEIASRLAKAKTSADVQKVLKTATDRRFKVLRDDFETMLK